MQKESRYSRSLSWIDIFGDCPPRQLSSGEKCHQYMPEQNSHWPWSSWCTRVNTSKIILTFRYTKQVISDLLQNRLDLSLLVISKALSKQGDKYASKQAHVELAERMRKRDSHTAPAIGDRVPYVIVKAAKSAKAYEKAEDPLYVLEHNIPLDYHYYLENQLRKPLMRIFEPIMDDPKTLLGTSFLFAFFITTVGDHTRTIAVPIPKTGGIVSFTVKKLSCIACKAPLQGEGISPYCSVQTF